MKTMKKILYFTMGLVLAVACEKEPAIMDPDREFLVYTEPSPNFDSTAYTSFYLPDSILVMSNAREPYYSTSYYATALLGQVRDNLKGFGYTQVTDPADADLGARLIYLERLDRYYHYYVNPFWWWGCPGYPADWSPDYLRTGSALVVELLDMVGEPSQPVPFSQSLYSVVWMAYLGGPASTSLYYDVLRMQDAIDQAFVQSPYLKK